MEVLESSGHEFCFLDKGLGVKRGIPDGSSKIQEFVIDKIRVIGLSLS